MEYMGAISEGTWNSFNNGGMCSEEADFMAQLLGNCSLPSDAPHYSLSSNFWPANTNNADADEGSMHSSDETNANMYAFSQGSGDSRGDGIQFHDGDYQGAPHQILFSNSNLMTMNYYMTEDNNISSRFHVLANNVMEGDDFLNQEVSNDSMESNEIAPPDFFQVNNLRTEIEMPMVEMQKEEKISCPREVSKKRSRVPSGEVQKSRKSMKLKKCQKVDDNDEDFNKNNNAALHRQSTSSCCSEDDSNASQELNGVNSSSSGIPKSGKARASRGSATDPQSLYARKRRERINERLRILQNLVPNGTKVDISTMLEEAVQYVKFLQLQIKLLSSDDHWMYAPLAYNGMDIGLDMKISAPKS